jgi:hypothetical protein
MGGIGESGTHHPACLALLLVKTARHGKSDIVSQLPNIGTVPVKGTWRAGDANAGCPSL